ncbi:transposase [Verrucomicrobiota bacterium]
MRKKTMRYIGKPKRLPEIFQTYSYPIYFITANTAQRRPLLICDEVHDAFREYAFKNAAQGRAVGRYMIMPDHIHFFVRLSHDDKLGVLVKLMKQVITKAIKCSTGLRPENRAPNGKSQDEGKNQFYWQPGFFDHLLRNAESYSQKWTYVVENPVRANLVGN